MPTHANPNPFPIIFIGAGPGDPELLTLKAARLIREIVRTPFNLATGPLLRARLIRLTDDEHIAVLVMHHIISDGWSMGVFVQELTTLYEAFVQGQDSPLPPLRIQYADYAWWQRQWLEGEDYQRQLAFWREQMTPPHPPAASHRLSPARHPSLRGSASRIPPLQRDRGAVTGPGEGAERHPV
jgi:hypothetical protein